MSRPAIPANSLEQQAAAGAYAVTAEANESGERLFVAGPFATYAEADELATAWQESADQWADDDPLLCTDRVCYRVEPLADLLCVEFDSMADSRRALLVGSTAANTVEG